MGGAVPSLCRGASRPVSLPGVLGAPGDAGWAWHGTPLLSAWVLGAGHGCHLRACSRWPPRLRCRGGGHPRALTVGEQADRDVWGAVSGHVCPHASPDTTSRHLVRAGVVQAPRRQESQSVSVPPGDTARSGHCSSGVCALCPRAVGQGATLDVNIGARFSRH